jgi:2-polyprenyl-6-methoxyphenol hydroxylase-like FAD-dependent oxidoreductase
MKADVLVIGAGPTGLLLGLELLRRNMNVRLIDKEEGPSIHSKALGIHAKTLEIFEKIGIVSDFIEKGLKLTSVSMNYGAKKKEISFDLIQEETGFPFILILPQSETERLLIKHFTQLGGNVEREKTFLGFDRNEVLIQHSDGKIERNSYKWIIACDGAHSTVRHALHLQFQGYALPEKFLIVDSAVSITPKIETFSTFISSKGVCICIPLPDNKYRFIFPSYRGEEIGIDKSIIHTLLDERMVTPNYHIENLEVEWISLFSIQQRMISRQRFENIFFAGDAAHVHSPAGGHGMNTGIQDAFNLAWKLELVNKNYAGQKILESYEDERTLIAKHLLIETARMTKVVNSTHPILFFQLASFLLNQKEIAHRFVKQSSMLNLHYRQSPIVFQPSRDDYWQGPQPGDRAPDVFLDDGKRLYDRFKVLKHILLLFEEKKEIIQKIHDHYNEWIEIAICDDQGVRKKYAAEPNSGYLIRPDGYIGFRSRSFKEDEFFSYLENTFKPSLLYKRP